MVITERLSNNEFTGLLQRLTARDWKQPAHRRFEAEGMAPDGRRKFGQVNELVIRVLRTEPAGLRARDFHLRIDILLDEPVSYSSVKNSDHRLS
jgi:hypothetical protein